MLGLFEFALIPKNLPDRAHPLSLSQWIFKGFFFLQLESSSLVYSHCEGLVKNPVQSGEVDGDRGLSFLLSQIFLKLPI